MRTIARDQDGMTRTSGRVTGAGNVVAGAGGFTVQKAATGQYTIRLNPSLIVLSGRATVEAGSAFIATVAAFAANSVVVCVFSTAGVAVDGPFNFEAVAR